MLEDGLGLEFAAHVRKSRGPSSKVPIISISGNTIDDQRKQYEGYNIDAFYQKPMTKTQLLNLLDFVKH